MTGPGVSPYPPVETALWLLRWARPSMRRSRGLAPAPMAGRRAGPDAPTLRVLCLGDLMCMNGDRVPEVDPALRALVRSADLVVGTCEAPVTGAPPDPRARYAFGFEMAQSYLAAFLGRLGVAPERCVLSVANNHAGDRGAHGLAETLERLRALGVTPVGARGGPGPTIVREVSGVRVALSAWTRWMNRDVFPPGTGVWTADEVEALSASGTPSSRAAARAASGSRVDCRIGLPHWDYEFCHYPRAATRASARRLVRSGFDLLVGSHPHVLQPVERIDDGLCAYSLGNLNGPAALLRSWSSRMLGVLEIEVESGGSRPGRLAAYALHVFVQFRTADGARLGTPGELPPRTRRRLKRRLRALYGARTAAPARTVPARAATAR